MLLLLVFLLGGVGENGKTLLKAIGVFWGSVFSVAVIVIPVSFNLVEVEQLPAQNIQRNSTEPSELL